MGEVTMDGVKHDQGKRQWHLLPMTALESVVRVLEFGAKKYAPDNWQKVPEPSTRYYDALQRHLVAWRSGEECDPESGEHHLAHAGCCLVFLLWFEVGGSTPRAAEPERAVRTDERVSQHENGELHFYRNTSEPEMVDDMQDGSRVVGYVPRGTYQQEVNALLQEREQLRQERDSNMMAVTELQSKLEHEQKVAAARHELVLQRERECRAVEKERDAAVKKWDTVQHELHAALSQRDRAQAACEQQAEIAGKLGARVADLQKDLTVAYDHAEMEAERWRKGANAQREEVMRLLDPAGVIPSGG